MIINPDVFILCNNFKHNNLSKGNKGAKSSEKKCNIMKTTLTNIKIEYVDSILDENKKRPLMLTVIKV